MQQAKCTIAIVKEFCTADIPAAIENEDILACAELGANEAPKLDRNVQKAEIRITPDWFIFHFTCLEVCIFPSL